MSLDCISESQLLSHLGSVAEFQELFQPRAGLKLMYEYILRIFLLFVSVVDRKIFVRIRIQNFFARFGLGI
jgi:hypothetical protein